ncbi:MAG: DUF2723 domain-containing protein, partial [Pedobacter sp.]
ADDVTYVSNMFGGLLSTLINQGKTIEGTQVANKYFEVIPQKFYTMRQVVSSFYITESLYRLNDLNRANQMINKSASHINKELAYLADVSESKSQLVSEQDVRIYLTYLAQMVRLTETFKQKELSKKLENQYNNLIGRFSPFASS